MSPGGQFLMSLDTRCSVCDTGANKPEAALDSLHPSQLGTADDNIHPKRVTSASSPTAKQLAEAVHRVPAEFGVNPDGLYDAAAVLDALARN